MREAYLDEIAPGRWEVSSYVDSQNGFGALIRAKWRAVVYREGEYWKLSYLRIGSEEIGISPEAIRLAEQDRRLAKAEAERKAAELKEMESRSTAQKKADAALVRSNLHAAACAEVVKLRGSPGFAQHSRLEDFDTEYASCRELGNSVWESKGVMDYAKTRAEKRMRVTWTMMFRSEANKLAGILYAKIGEYQIGDEAQANAQALGN